MATSLDTIRRIEVRAETPGVAEATAKLNQLSAAQEGVTAASVRTERATLSMERALERVQRREDVNYRAMAELSRISDTLNRSRDQGLISLERQNELYDLAARRLNVVTDSQRRLAEATRVANDAAAKAAQFQTNLNERLGVRTLASGAARSSADAFLADFGGVEGVARDRARQTGLAFQTELEARLISGIGASARDSAAVFEAEFRRLDDIARARAQQTGAEFTRSLNERLGVNRQMNSAAGSASVFQEQFAEQDRLEALRTKYVPLIGLQQTYRDDLANINSLAREGAITERQRLDAVRRTKSGFAEQVVELNRVAAGGGLARHELINLSRQGQDVFVSLTSGQSPFTVLIQQGTQIADVFAASNGTVGGFFKQTASWLGSILTPARLASGAVAGIGVAAVTAAMQWGEAQRQINTALLGIGRASGASRSDINAIASGGSSTFGLSVSEARELGTALAATGRIGKENLAPIVSIGQDIARFYGIDAPQAAELLAKSFADPARGAAELNQRLGFMDAALERNIKNLVDQNRAYEAQRLLIDAVRSGLEGVAATKGASGQFWTAVGNAISNAWDRLGQFTSEVTGIGWMPGLEEKIAVVRERISELEQISNRRSAAVNAGTGTTAQLERERAELARLTAEYERNGRAAFEAQNRRDSFRNSEAVRSALPEVAARQAMTNTLEVLKRIENDAAFDENNALLRSLGLTREQLSLARSRTDEALGSFKTQIERTIANSEISLDAINARTPRQRAEIQRRSTLLNSSGSADEKALQGQLAYTIALRNEQRQIADAERDRMLTATQRIDQANLELEIAGKSTAEQERARAILQAKHSLEQDALRTYGDREAYDRKHLEELTKQVELEARKKQLLAEQNLARDVAFERSQIFRSPEDQQIASRLRSVYGENYASQMDGALAAQMRFNQALEYTRDIGSTAFKGLLADMQAGMSFSEALKNQMVSALNKISDKLIDMAVNNLFGNAFGGSSLGGGGGGLLGSIFGGGTGFVHTPGGFSGAFPMPMANGGIMTPYGSLPLNKYAGGGIATSPQVAIFGEGRMNEAYVPLPDGRSIPVSIDMPQPVVAGGGQQGVHVTVGVDVEDDGRLVAFVKDVSQKATQQGIKAFAGSQEFTARAVKAARQAPTKGM